MDSISTISRNRNLWASLALLCWVFAATGCAQVMAYRQPPPLDRDFLQPGVERPVVAGRLGEPTSSEEHPGEGTLTESYSYADGGVVNGWGGKTGRIILYTAGDVFTLFLSQVLWMPAELLMDGTDYYTTVDYERRPIDDHWVAARIVERDTDGKETFARGELPASSVALQPTEEAAPPAALE